ncbi:unnamed protein product [Cylindrotheca closterium]|uniref:MORN repeat-containing protein 5 n=1 Tax=Cylindrotheca closterium TaxID=2856 RepID=A0AAD2FIG6_9STRA|nr:unnamed protein product [Cylindrotheca closterium]
MSTVALKGKLELIETKETIQSTAKGDSQHDEKPLAAITAKSKNQSETPPTWNKAATITRKIRKWHWKGKWAFGSHINETFANKNSATPLPKKAHKLQPFHYYFEEEADPSDVALPSLALLESLPTDPNTPKVDNIVKNNAQYSAGLTSRSTMHDQLPNNRFKKRAELSLSLKSSKDDGMKARSPCKADPRSDDATTTLSGGLALEEKEGKTLPSRSSLSCSGVKSKTNAENATDAPHSILNKTCMDPKSLTPSTEVAIMPRRLSSVSRQNYDAEPKVEKAMKPDLKCKSNEKRKVSRIDDLGQMTPGKYGAKLQVTGPKQLDLSLSFAVVSSTDPPFTDALSFFRHKNGDSLDHENTKNLAKSAADDAHNPCPPSGLWKGYFQNATVGRGKGTQRVQEQFYLFLNARPGNNAVFSFDGVQNQMPPTHFQDPILVRGSGDNQFGMFEFCGHLNISTMEMEIQRQYVHVEEEIPTTKPSPNKKKKQRLATPVVTRHKSTRPYFTRKRQPSWKVKSQEGNGEDESSKRKKRKMNVETSNTAEGYSDGGRIPSDIVAAGSMESVADSILLSTGSCINHVDTAKTPSKRKSSNPVGIVRRQGLAAGTFKTIPKHTHIAALSDAMKLPSTGDAQLSKWRAAHFLYYQRHDPEEPQQQQQQQQGKFQHSKQQQSSTGSSFSSTSTNPKYVIYEGEMVDSKRAGRGTCLYSNNMLYEGEWKWNKEHGYGIVMTSDRTRIIYEGEFERGRMQGKGIYYYEQAKNSKCTDGGARYTGEFKENMRNGIGKYYLPDTSVYEGMWSNGLMNGRGVLTWADNSCYDGEWKDGIRTGQGILKTSDGFYYDGMWVNNSMEGRGFAVYPCGQKYEGLFSKGRREGRGTLTLTNGVVYEGRFRDDAVDGQGTMKMSRATVVPTKKGKDDFMVPISFQSDMSHIHAKAGFTSVGE